MSLDTTTPLEDAGKARQLEYARLALEVGDMHLALRFLSAQIEDKLSAMAAIHPQAVRVDAPRSDDTDQAV